MSEEDLRDRDTSFFKKNLTLIEMYLSNRFQESSSPEIANFDIAEIPPISLRKYMDRIIKTALVSHGAAVCAVVYLNRIHGSGHVLTRNNIYKLLMIAVRVSAKVWDDSVIHPQDYAYLAGIDHITITQLELQFNSLLKFRLWVSAQEFNHVLYMLGADPSWSLPP